MAKPTVKRLDEGQLEMMWNFLRMGYQKPNIPARAVIEAMCLYLSGALDKLENDNE